MSDVASKAVISERKPDPGAVSVPDRPSLDDIRPVRRRMRIMPVLLTGVAVCAAAVMTWALWQAYMAAPWTRDGQVRAYIVTMAPEVAGRIQALPVADNQFVHKGDGLMVIDPTNFLIAVSSARAQVEQAEADMKNKQLMAKRRETLTTLSTSVEEKESYATQAQAAVAAHDQALSSLARANVDLKRTRIVSPVNGWITNLLVQVGDYVNVGQRVVSIVNADSFWVDGYFEETKLPRIHEGDPALIKLMGSRQIVRGHVESIARGITVKNAEADSVGLATVDPVFTWVRLAQRVPVRIHIDVVPEGVRLVAGQTATVQIDASPGNQRP
jgi:multidrug resistance efflux pump